MTDMVMAGKDERLEADGVVAEILELHPVAGLRTERIRDVDPQRVVAQEPIPDAGDEQAHEPYPPRYVAVLVFMIAI